jgi:predicted phosphodiesterase
MRLAVIADIHGNLPALDAVLADIGSRDVARIVNLGDVVSGPLWPRETMRRLAGMPMPTVRGNHDRWVSEKDPATMGASDRFAHRELDATALAALGALPVTAELGHGILAFHATPENDNRYLVEVVRAGQLARDSVAGIGARLGAVGARIVLCGHSHLPQLVQLPAGPLIVNPGSVGCPAYDDPGDDPHVSESASPHARYAVLTLGGDRVAVELIAIEYAWDAAASRAERNGRPDWAHALRTGLMPGS